MEMVTSQFSTERRESVNLRHLVVNSGQRIVESPDGLGKTGRTDRLKRRKNIGTDTMFPPEQRVTTENMLATRRKENWKMCKAVQWTKDSEIEQCR